MSVVTRVEGETPMARQQKAREGLLGEAHRLLLTVCRLLREARSGAFPERHADSKCVPHVNKDLRSHRGITPKERSRPARSGQRDRKSIQFAI